MIFIYYPFNVHHISHHDSSFISTIHNLICVFSFFLDQGAENFIFFFFFLQSYSFWFCCFSLLSSFSSVINFCFISSSFFTSLLRWKGKLLNQVFLIQAFNAVYISLYILLYPTTLINCNFVFSQLKIFQDLLLDFSLWPTCYLEVYFNLQILSMLLLSFCCQFLVYFDASVEHSLYYFYSFKFDNVVLWHRMRSVLLYVPCEFENNVFSAVVKYSYKCHLDPKLIVGAFQFNYTLLIFCLLSLTIPKRQVLTSLGVRVFLHHQYLPCVF